MKQKLFLTLVMLLTVCSFSRAKEAYAVYDSGDQTLTFRYDDDWANQPTSVYKYKLNTGSNTPGWIADGKKFKRVIFVSSFANYRPTSTYKWFYEQTELTTFTGLSYLKTDNVTTMYRMFYGCSGLTSLYLGNWNTSTVSDMSLMFYDCSGLTSLDLSGWNTEQLENMIGMFWNCSGLTSLKISGWNTSKVTSLKNVFTGCQKLKSLDLSSWNTSNVKNIEFIFYFCKSVETLNLSGWDLGKVTNMSGMFAGCNALTSLNLSEFKTTNATDMSGMFDDCKSLKSLNLSSFNTANVTNMSLMFYGCTGLTSLDLSGFNTTNVTNMSDMFDGCTNLKSLDLSSFNTANVTNMSMMFYGCTGLTSLDLSSFNTANVTNMSFMFYGCTGLTSLDLSGWNTENVKNMDGMFKGCSGLKTIYVGDRWNTGKVSSSNGMFFNCYQLVGGSGTKYNSSHDDATYARIDGGTSRPGYFSTNKKEYDLMIAGTPVTNYNMSDVLGNGKFSYSPSTKTLTVKGSYKVTGSGTIGSSQLIRNNIEGLTIDVIQDAILECEGILIWLQNNTTIKGNGKLTLKSGGDTGIYLSKSASATIENMNIDIEGYWGIAGPLDPVREKITIKSSNITITTSTVQYPENAAAICDLPGGIILEDCSITYPTNATIQNNGVYSGTKLAKDVTIKAKGGITTEINEALPQDNVQCSMFNVQCDSWYTIDGRKLNGMPTKKGIYIQNRKKRIIK